MTVLYSPTSILSPGRRNRRRTSRWDAVVWKIPINFGGNEVDWEGREKLGGGIILGICEGMWLVDGKIIFSSS